MGTTVGAGGGGQGRQATVQNHPLLAPVLPSVQLFQDRQAKAGRRKTHPKGPSL